MLLKRARWRNKVDGLSHNGLTLITRLTTEPMFYENANVFLRSHKKPMS